MLRALFIAIALAVSASAWSQPFPGPGEPALEKTKRFEKWIMQCKLDRMTDKYDCSLRTTLVQRGETFFLDIRPQLGVSMYFTNQHSAQIRVDRNPPATSAICIGSTCVFSKEDSNRLIKEFSEGSRILVRAGRSSGAPEGYIDLAGFPQALEALTKESGPVSPPDELPSPKDGSGWRRLLRSA